MFELREASKTYDDGTVGLHPTSLVFSPGQTTSVIGPSGCGKSTVVRLLNGLLPPTLGEVVFDGDLVDVHRPQALRRMRGRIGYVIQEGGLFPHMTARRNVTLMAEQLGWAPGDMDARLMELVALTRFPEDGLERRPRALSGGQRQRVSLMRALMLDPDALLLDEPLGALDPMIRAGLQDDLREIASDLGKTVVLVTHDMAEAAYLGDRIVLMRDGEVIQQGTLEELRDEPVEPFVRAFMQAQRGWSQA
ncbi:MAG: ATP-binding cassette domain-containing protein [Myxococcota bacterium]